MKRKILICDDDEGILEMLEMVLDAEDYDVTTEQNSLKMFDRMAQVQPDMLILDLWMPVLSGDQITAKVRSTPAYQHLPILIISASRDGAEIAKNAGASAYLAKPFDIGDFMDAVEKLDTQSAA
ncbi:response regulator [Mucilaginibacter roseus]|uniref:Response regulator n=1 Tax=Mucilaginibacter roseus TaxID=1528868 RepID=A0ABS8U5A8_9SPHI|nr:response regulator [Mucilaginibacter roseus]MCD8741017.1 response regulator [Mucilaginibacter roseus]